MSGELVGHRIADVDSDDEESFDWSEELLASEEIDESDWALTPDDSSPTIKDSTNSENTTTVEFSGLEFGVVYTLTNTIVTTQGRTLVRSMTIRATHA